MHFFAFFGGQGDPKCSCRPCAGNRSTPCWWRSPPARKMTKRRSHAWEAVLNQSFKPADALGMVLSESGWPVVGFTTMVVVLVRGSILVANCGDSRAVLCRAGDAIPLSKDQR
ncbi:hypothetical protein VPH35_120333 [Triticum aestivum]